ncbi:MAG: DUF2764 family protein [Rikenellaceae bacterium]
MANYHYIVSSLIDYSIENDAKGFDTEALCLELQGLLSTSDWKKLSDLWWFFDLRNILDIRSGRKGVYSPLSNLTQSEVEIISKYYDADSTEEIELEQLPVLPKEISKLLLAYKDDSFASENNINTFEPIDSKIWAAYYKMATSSKSKFIATWSQFDLDVRNISAAFTARVKKRNIQEVLIGENEVVKLILSNESVQDFGLKNEFAATDELFQILSEKDMLLKERNLDKLRIKIIDELVAFDYFNMETILAYMVKISLLNRWSMLSSERGDEVLTSLTSKLTANDIIAQKRSNS